MERQRRKGMTTATGTAPATMVRWMRTAGVRNGRGAKALKVAQELAAFAGSKLGLPIAVFYDAARGGGRVCWMADLPDMGAMEQALRALMSDPHYLAMIDQPGVTELFIDGT